MPKLSPQVLKQRAEVMSRIKEMNNRGMFPSGYGKLVLERANKILEEKGLKKLSLNRISKIASGTAYNEVVIDILIDIAKEGKLEQQLRETAELLK